MVTVLGSGIGVDEIYLFAPMASPSRARVPGLGGLHDDRCVRRPMIGVPAVAPRRQRSGRGGSWLFLKWSADAHHQHQLHLSSSAAVDSHLLSWRWI
jgi:hypothetical protein